MQSVDSCGNGRGRTDGRTDDGWQGKEGRKEGRSRMAALSSSKDMRARVRGWERRKETCPLQSRGKGDRWESGSLARPSASDDYFRKSNYSVLTTTIPLLGGSGKVLQRAGSHLGILDHVPLLHLKADSKVGSSRPAQHRRVHYFLKGVLISRVEELLPVLRNRIPDRRRVRGQFVVSVAVDRYILTVSEGGTDGHVCCAPHHYVWYDTRCVAFRKRMRPLSVRLKG